MAIGICYKHSWIFNKRVDAAALGLHDYHQIVKHPMDLGTVKSNFGKNLYASPGDFAADVRLTFENAMLYNPKGDEVHKMADELLVRFEELYRPILEKIEGNNEDRRIEFHDRREQVDTQQGSHTDPCGRGLPTGRRYPEDCRRFRRHSGLTKAAKFVSQRCRRDEILRQSSFHTPGIGLYLLRL